MLDRRLFCLGALAVSLLPWRAAAAEAAAIRDLYDADDGITARAQALEGARIQVSGHMAPPLKADLNFFVLTAQPMAICPFCEGEDDWLPGILPVLTKRRFQTVAFYKRIVASGVLRLDPFVEPETGFAVKMRLEDADFRAA